MFLQGELALVLLKRAGLHVKYQILFCSFISELTLNKLP